MTVLGSCLSVVAVSDGHPNVTFTLEGYKFENCVVRIKVGALTGAMFEADIYDEYHNRLSHYSKSSLPMWLKKGYEEYLALHTDIAEIVENCPADASYYFED